MQLYLKTFASRHFRNLAETQVELHPRFNLFVGENGQGKTNALEAIYYLLTLRPMRPVRPRQLIAWDQQESVVKGELTGRVDRKLSVSFTKNKRSLQINGAPPLRIDDYLYDTQVVAFTPEDLQLVRGAPDLRRRFIDRAIFHTDINYLSEVRQYLRVLKHRNALLKSNKVDPHVLEVLNEQFVAWASRILRRRLAVLGRLQPYMQQAFNRIFPEQEVSVDLSYNTQLGDLSHLTSEMSPTLVEEDLQQNLNSQLKRYKQRELDRRSTLVGPHLDDIQFTFQDRPFKVSASQGQTRALVLALKVAEIFDIQERTQQHPILLLDDVAGELDPRHSSFLFAFLEETPGQVLLSTTTRDTIQLPNLDRFPHFTLRGGEIH
ncbi:MAG: DNA replication/repair protein RecF [Deltaproteobacteria bacterium]|nr:MAG: DNA replication/repair protein RecF [Deltaproteobacteria bacterium]